MPIRRSSAVDVARLIDDLSSGELLRRETARARLAVIGSRAVSRLSALAADDAAAGAARVSALQALEAIGDPRVLPLALTLGDQAGALGLAAIGVAGAIAKSDDARASRAFEWLTSVVLDAQAADARRLAALTALEGGSARHLAPVYAALAADASPRLAARATRRTAGQTIPLERALAGGLPDDPSVVSAMIREDADTTSVTTLRRVLDLLRAREQDAPPAQRPAWSSARGQVHQSLAARASRLGIYDLRETLEHASVPLAVGFLAAAAAVGDASCLDPLAAAWLAAPMDQHWWREHLAEAFRAIVRREGLKRRDPVLKKILERRPGAAVLVAEGKR
jgi:hypothetical protein